MKGFLFDENLPRLIQFTPSLPVTHVSSVNSNPTDTEIWEYARANMLAIVSKDADFYHRIMPAQPPPWVVHLKIGNLRRRDFHRFLSSVWPQIERLLPKHKLVTVEQHCVHSVR
jgi:predicted nuclease of predicted toxin-antitoxin system